MDEAHKKVLSRLENQCARREYCRDDVMRKALRDLEGDREAAEEVVESLVANKFVDELRYCSAFAREKAALTGWGPIKIRFALRAKHIADSTIDEAIAQIDPSSADGRLERLLAAKWKTLQGDPQAKLKLIRFALSRGYDYESVRGLIDSFK